MKTNEIITIDPTLPGYEDMINRFNNDVSKGKHVFLFLFMDGCGPCNQTKPEWKKMQQLIKKKHFEREVPIVVAINQKLFGKLNGVGDEPMGYPSLRYIKHPQIEEYEDSQIEKKDRSAKSFMNWIETKIKAQRGGNSARRHCRGGKWSLKYKRSINCRRPKGFSQRQHCKYGRKTKKMRHNR